MTGRGALPAPGPPPDYGGSTLLEQGRFGPPPTAVINLRLTRTGRAWSLWVSSRAEGADLWERFDLDGLSTVDALEAAVVETQRRLIG